MIGFCTCVVTLPVVTSRWTINGGSVVFSFQSWWYSDEEEGYQLTHIGAKLNITALECPFVLVILFHNTYTIATRTCTCTLYSSIIQVHVCNLHQ